MYYKRRAERRRVHYIDTHGRMVMTCAMYMGYYHHNHVTACDSTSSFIYRIEEYYNKLDWIFNWRWELRLKARIKIISKEKANKKILIYLQSIFPDEGAKTFIHGMIDCKGLSFEPKSSSPPPANQTLTIFIAIYCWPQYRRFEAYHCVVVVYC